MLRSWLGVVAAMVAFLFWSEPAHAQGFDPLGAAQQAAETKPSADEAAAQERLARLQAKMGKDKASRVIVLPWPDTRTNFSDTALQTLVRNRIGRAGAKFYPEIDLYQEGRRRRTANGQPVNPMDQPGSVPDSLLDDVREKIADARRKLGKSNANAAIAGQLLPLVDAIWFNDRVETRQVLFDLYVTIGQATFNARDQTPPYFQMVGSEQNNYFLYEAAAMIWEEQQAGVQIVTNRKPGGDVGAYINDIVQLINDGIHAPIPLAFNERGVFDAKKFTAQYKVIVNGLERIVDEDGLVMTPRGRVDLSLERSDGFSMSERTDILGLDEKLYFPMEVARSKLGYDLLNQLMSNPEECAPELRDDTVGSVAAYAALHPGDEVYLVIPKGGSARDSYVWRWDSDTGTLQFLIDANRGFPVRFSALVTTGIEFGGLSLNKSAASRATNIGTTGPRLSLRPEDVLSATPVGIPIDVQLRGQFSRLMFGFGMTFAKNIAGNSGGHWTDRFQTKGGTVIVPTDTATDDTFIDVDGNAYKVSLKQLDFSRTIYGLLGVVILKDATAGIGPRAYVKFGGSNVPHALEASGHLGMTSDATFGKKDFKGRVAPLLDLDLFAGALIPYGDTLFRESEKNDKGKFPAIVSATFGMTLGVGTTF